VTRIASGKGTAYQALIRRLSAQVSGHDGEKPKLLKAVAEQRHRPGSRHPQDHDRGTEIMTRAEISGSTLFRRRGKMVRALIG
jgi:hypothetical protein